MDQFQEKLLNLELRMGQIKEYPIHLMNCLKYNMEFDKIFDKNAAANERSKILSMCCSGLDGFLEQSRQLDDLLEECSHAARGNQRYFDGLMQEYGITEEAVENLLGERNPSNHPETRRGEENNGDEDNNDSSFEMPNENLTHMRLQRGQ